ncbi:coproporphyrinogen oxidase [Nocardia tenerifensis]|uniref:coproporphyrinogen oxidase n=2 Tax=Nocardia tenerifensis TaxID=228006 RepID=A0A318K745_9NOCA|nr:oxygen-dependent coproporphyrinogen oxidase [Nocardia tenerifensis]PXX69168.1 coproporphyrinogen oxidase [Nocardia tenerifensis]
MGYAQRIADQFMVKQQRLVEAFEEFDGEARFQRSRWERPELGGGLACVLQDGRVFERAGVNVSLVSKDGLPESAAHPDITNKPFTATGISLVLHPLNPFAPSYHANFRYFEIDSETWWFGAVCDLTPAYGFDEDAIHFHRTLETWCNRHGPHRYPTGKAACDTYFTIPHRREMRGIGGVFFDRLTGDFDPLLDFITDGIATILPSYLPILQRRCPTPYGERERAWQLLRRGRYVEFNLVHDRGTRFGLQTNGNIEAILMSLPPLAAWQSQTTPQPGTPEADTARFLQPTDWITKSFVPVYP